MEEAIAEITQVVSQHSGTGVTAKGLPKLSLTMPLLAPAPSTRSLPWKEGARSASQRLKAFTLVSYVIAVVFLAGAGFTQGVSQNRVLGLKRLDELFLLLPDFDVALQQLAKLFTPRLVNKRGSLL